MGMPSLQYLQLSGSSKLHSLPVQGLSFLVSLTYLDLSQ